MSAMETFLTGPLVGAIGWALLHLLWQGVLVAAILAAALALLQRQSANARYIASCGALLLLVALGVATAYRMYQPDIATGSWAGNGPAVGPVPTPIGSAADDAPPVVAFSFLSFISAHLAQIVAIW